MVKGKKVVYKNFDENVEAFKNFCNKKLSRSEKQINFLVELYKKKYEKYGCSLLDWNIIVDLMDDKMFIKKFGTKWYAFVGDGGTGKTTIAKNFFHFLDEDFTLDDLQLDTPSFIKRLADFEKDNSDKVLGKAIFMDEPDDSIHPQTATGRIFRKVLGKARQGHYALGICATDLNDIPTYIWRKIQVIVFTPYLGYAMVFKNRASKEQYPITEIRRKYAKEGYKIFFSLKKEGMALGFKTFGLQPFTASEERSYIGFKRKDFDDDLKELVKLLEDPVNKKAGLLDAKRKVRFEGYVKHKISRKKIVELEGLSEGAVSKLMLKYGLRDISPNHL